MPVNYFSNLCVEVIEKIFDYSLRHFQPDDLGHHQPPEAGTFRQWTPLPLVGVCKRWNEIVATNPRLWREWFLVVGQDANELDILSRKIKKLSTLSKGSLITVQLFFSETTLISEDTQSLRCRLIYEDIQLYSSRIRTLFLRGPEMSFHYLPRLVLPALERLEVYNTSRWEHEDDPPDYDPIQIDAPNLTYLRLSSISPRHFDVPMANIRTLTLQRLLDFVSIRLLSTTPNVERVGLYDVSIDDLGPDPKNLPKIDLPQLRVLDWLHTYNNQDLYPTDVLNKISAPRLEHFRMNCDNIWEGCTFPSVHKWLKTTSSLKSFFLRTSANPEDLLQDLLLDAWTLSSQALVVLYDGPDHPDSDPTPYPWYPEDFGDSLTTHVLQNAEWKRLFQVYYVLPPVPLVPSQT